MDKFVRRPIISLVVYDYREEERNAKSPAARDLDLRTTLPKRPRDSNGNN